MDATPTEDLVLYLADTSLAMGLQYGLWVERAPSTEEQVALSSMSQDKLGHARAFFDTAEKVTGSTSVELLYDRDPDAFRWTPGWAHPMDRWEHLVLAQAILGRALMHDLRALSEDCPLREPLGKIEQEEIWHTRHGDAWLERAAAAGNLARLQDALDDLWPFAQAAFGAAGEERFPEDLSSGHRAKTDDQLRAAFADEVVPLLERTGLNVPPFDAPSPKQLEQLEDATAAHQVELVGLLQDPEGRALAEMA